jgi:two-component system, OmpR family, response regulator
MAFGLSAATYAGFYIRSEMAAALGGPAGETEMTFRAFLVEDSPTIRHNLIDTLKELAQVEPVGTSETEHEARRWLASNEWDLAIIDLFLRVGSGLNVLEGLRQRKPHQKVVVLSNHSSRDVRWRCKQLGADAVFDKSTELEALMDYCVRERRQLQQDRAAPAVVAGSTAAATAPATALPAAPA